MPLVKPLISVSLCAVLLSGEPPRVPLDIRMTFPAEYRSTYVRYLVVDRPDGLVRYAYASPDAAHAVRENLELPVGATFVLESIEGKRDARGRLIRDGNRHLVASPVVLTVDVLRKRDASPPSTNTSSTSSRNWLSGQFDPRTGEAMNENVADCRICHQSVSGRDFIFSKRSLRGQLLTGRLQRRDCEKPARQLCDNDFEQVVIDAP